MNYSDLYKKEFKKYLYDFLPTIGRKTSQVNQMATDVFYLEHNCTEKDFMYWFQSDKTFDEAKEKLNDLFKNRKSYKASLKNHINYMMWFRQFLALKDVCEPLDDSYTYEEKMEHANKIEIHNLKNIAIKQSSQSPKIINGTTKTYSRSPYISQYAKRMAAGVCQLCGNPAPFKRNDGEHYLETHHIVWLSKGGEDSIENTVALCPNCHRKMHVLNSKEDINKLKKVARSMCDNI